MGGIDRAPLGEARAAGAHGVAVIRAILAAAHPAAASAELRRALDEPRS
jgi:thiamine monophosphate synthase